MIGAADYAAELCRLYVLLLLAAAALGKARSRAGFERSLIALTGLGESAGRAAALAVIAAEAGVALLLLFGGGAAVAGMAAAFVLLTLFTVVIAAALARGRTLSCNCFGGGDRPITGRDLARNALLLACCAFYLLEAPRPENLDPAGRILLAGAAIILLLASLYRERTIGSGRPAAAQGPLTVPIGFPLPPEGGLSFDGRPGVIVFLSVGCPACQARTGELSALLPGMRRSGVGLILAGIGDIGPLLAGTPLADRLVQPGPAGLEALNPRRAVPAYIFVDEDGVARASDYLGDEDWSTFAAEMLKAGG